MILDMDSAETEGALPLGVTLVRWLRTVGREDEAIGAAYGLGLLTEDDFEAAWREGFDVLDLIS